jgi:ribosomal silencing factor RsfS
VTLDNRLAAFVAGLATSPRQLAAYRDDPEAAMNAAELSEQEKEVLRSGDWSVICEFLGGDDTRPMLVSDDKEEDK